VCGYDLQAGVRFRPQDRADHRPARWKPRAHATRCCTPRAYGPGRATGAQRVAIGGFILIDEASNATVGAGMITATALISHVNDRGHDEGKAGDRGQPGDPRPAADNGVDHRDARVGGIIADWHLLADARGRRVAEPLFGASVPVGWRSVGAAPNGSVCTRPGRGTGDQPGAPASLRRVCRGCASNRAAGPAVRALVGARLAMAEIDLVQAGLVQAGLHSSGED